MNKHMISRALVKVYINFCPTWVCVSPSAVVAYEVFSHPVLACYILCVHVDGKFIGWHCGERSGDVIRFVREADAVRLAEARNASWAAWRSLHVA